jgi:hypothetical protein
LFASNPIKYRSERGKKMGEKAIKGKAITNVLSCLVVSVLLMSTFSVAVIATNSSNSIASNVTDKVNSSVDPKPLYLDPARPTEVRVEDLLSGMTLEEKAAQLDILEGALALRQCRRRHSSNESYPGEPGTGSVLSRLFNFWRPEDAAEAMNEIQKYTINHTHFRIPAIIGTDAPLGASVGHGTIFPITP